VKDLVYIISPSKVREGAVAHTAMGASEKVNGWDRKEQET